MLKQTGENREPFVRRIQHLFYSKENDWGFSNFMLWTEMLDSSKGYFKDDSIILEVYVTADAPHGVRWAANACQIPNISDKTKYFTYMYIYICEVHNIA